MHYKDIAGTETYCPLDEGVQEKSSAKSKSMVARGAFKVKKYTRGFKRYQPMVRAFRHIKRASAQEITMNLYIAMKDELSKIAAKKSDRLARALEGMAVGGALGGLAGKGIRPLAKAIARRPQLNLPYLSGLAGIGAGGYLAGRSKKASISIVLQKLSVPQAEHDVPARALSRKLLSSP